MIVTNLKIGDQVEHLLYLEINKVLTLKCVRSAKYLNFSLFLKENISINLRLKKFRVSSSKSDERKKKKFFLLPHILFVKFQIPFCNCSSHQNPWDITYMSSPLLINFSLYLAIRSWNPLHLRFSQFLTFGELSISYIWRAKNTKKV